MYLTTKTLRKMGACTCGLKKFKKLFGDEMKVNLKNLREFSKWGTAVYGVCYAKESFVPFSEWLLMGFMDCPTSEYKKYQKWFFATDDINNDFKEDKITCTKHANEVSRILLIVLKQAKKDNLFGMGNK